MNILALAATAIELDSVVSSIDVNKLNSKNIKISSLITGVGVTATSYKLTKELLTTSYDLVLNVGIAGNFSEKLCLGDVCAVEYEVFADLGVEDVSGFTSFFQQGLMNADEFPYHSGVLHCPYLAGYSGLGGLPKVRAATVSTVSGIAATNSMREQLFSPDIETMEGAAVFYACLQERVPFLQLRAISNRVGVREKSQWNIPLALSNLGDQASRLIYSL